MPGRSVPADAPSASRVTWPEIVSGSSRLPDGSTPGFSTPAHSPCVKVRPATLVTIAWSLIGKPVAAGVAVKPLDPVGRVVEQGGPAGSKLTVAEPGTRRLPSVVSTAVNCTVSVLVSVAVTVAVPSAPVVAWPDAGVSVGVPPVALSVTVLPAAGRPRPSCRYTLIVA